jgi:hypothetical protein
MYQMKKGGSSKPMKKMQKGGSKKTAPKAMSMKELNKKYPGIDTTAAGDVRGTEMNAYAPKKVLEKYNDTYNAFDKKFKKGPSYKKGGSVGTSKKTKMAMGGSLKDVPAGKVGLSKLPTAVRNKMGYKQMGGPTSSSNSSFSSAAKSAAAKPSFSNVGTVPTNMTTPSSSPKTKMTGVTEEGPFSKIPAAGAMRKTKSKERSADGNYMKKTVTRETPAGKSSDTKVRRTVQGILRGAPSVQKYKKGGSIGKSKKK